MEEQTESTGKELMEQIPEELNELDNGKKIAMIMALRRNLGVVFTSCKTVGISRQTHYLWCNNDPVYKGFVNELQEIALDVVESKLLSNILKGDTTAIIFYLKTKGRERGYTQNAQPLKDEDIFEEDVTLDIPFLEDFISDIDIEHKE